MKIFFGKYLSQFDSKYISFFIKDTKGMSRLDRIVHKFFLDIFIKHFTPKISALDYGKMRFQERDTKLDQFFNKNQYYWIFAKTIFNVKHDLTFFNWTILFYEHTFWLHKSIYFLKWCPFSKFPFLSNFAFLHWKLKEAGAYQKLST